MRAQEFVIWPASMDSVPCSFLSASARKTTSTLLCAMSGMETCGRRVRNRTIDVGSGAFVLSLAQSNASLQDILRREALQLLRLEHDTASIANLQALAILSVE